MESSAKTAWTGSPARLKAPDFAIFFNSQYLQAAKASRIPSSFFWVSHIGHPAWPEKVFEKVTGCNHHPPKNGQ
jgi:hypothetical protein